MHQLRPILIRGGRIIDPASAYDARGDLLLVEGRVAGRGPDIASPADAVVIDATNQVVAPGFLDLHTHLRFPGFPEKETMESGTAAAAAGGFTTVCAMANTEPVVDNVFTLRQVEGEAARVGRIRVRQLAAVSLGLRGEVLSDLSALAQAGAVAFSDDGKPIWNQNVMREALAVSERLNLAVSVHEEDPAVVRDGVANDGAPARRLGLPVWPCAGEAGMVERDIRLLWEIGGRLHIAHVSCRETVDLIRAAKLEGLPITAEVTPHHLRLTDTLLEGEPVLGLDPAHPRTKVNPPLRSSTDVDALIEALADGTIDAVATDHAPHADIDKSGSFQQAAFGFTGIELAMPILLDLVREGRVDLVTLVNRLTCGPAHCFGLEGGSLVPGSVADICIFDPNLRWVVQPEDLRSLGKNTPLLGATVTGRVTYTIVDGRIVHGTEHGVVG